MLIGSFSRTLFEELLKEEKGKQGLPKVTVFPSFPSLDSATLLEMVLWIIKIIQ
jgi:hypothetical protein